MLNLWAIAEYVACVLLAAAFLACVFTALVYVAAFFGVL